MFKLLNNEDFSFLEKYSVEELSNLLINSVNSIKEQDRKEFVEELELVANDIFLAKDLSSEDAKILLIGDLLSLPRKQEFEFRAQKKYAPSGPEVGMEGEPLRTTYLPWQTPQMGAIPDIRTESGRRFWEGKRPKFKDPDLYKKQWNLGPYADDILAMSGGARPDFDLLPPNQSAFLRNEMQKDILDGVTGASAREWQKSLPDEQRSLMPSIPRPFLMDMVYKYLLVNEDFDAAERFAADGVDAASRHGFNTKWILKRMFDRMPNEDLFDYWYAITQHKILPLVNPEYVDNRFGSLAMGQNITELFNSWVSNTPIIEKDVFNWTEVPFKTPEEVPAGEIKQAPDQPFRTPEIDTPKKEIPAQPQMSKPFWNEEEYDIENRTQEVEPAISEQDIKEKEEVERLRKITDKFGLPFEGRVRVSAHKIP